MVAEKREICCYFFTGSVFYSRYNTDWITNTETVLDPNNSVIKRLRCICVAKTKGADQLRCYSEAGLRLCFRICKLLVFS